MLRNVSTCDIFILLGKSNGNLKVRTDLGETGKKMKRRCFPSVSKFLILISVFFVAVAPSSFSQRKQNHNELTLIGASYIPVGYDPYFFPGMKCFVDMVNEKGKGLVKLDMYWGGTLLSANQLLPGLLAGCADIVVAPSTYFAGTFPVLGIRSMPLWDNIQESYRSLKFGSPFAVFENEILKKKNIFQLSAGGVIFEFLWTRDKKVQCPEDMKGLKIRVSGKIQAKIVQSLGAIPVTLPSAELPQALQRGVIDGAIINPWTAQGRGVEEYCKYLLVHPICGISNSLFVLQDRWEKWPEEVRKLLLDVSVEHENIMFESSNSLINDAQLYEEIIPFYESKGMQAVYISKENAQKFQNAVVPAINWWKKEVGHDTGKKALRYIMKNEF